MKFCSLVYSGGLSRDLDEIFVEIQDPRSLLTHELMSKPLIREKEKKIKGQGINVNAIALKSSKNLQEESSEDESEEDDEMDYLVKNFTRFMKHENERSKHESKKKMMKEPQRVQSSNKRGSSSKKAYVATWSDEEDSTDNEVAHLCFMALQEGEGVPIPEARVPIPTAPELQKVLENVSNGSKTSPTVTNSYKLI
ncbi:hypothetical protein V6N12_012934 [Hibiscus sabdariffa]|uniref:Uncharacterized protein n=1 Tax=Hibiscus sabdariffa TaxID=183260 RepID=A0ABR2EG99_9ROSI